MRRGESADKDMGGGGGRGLVLRDMMYECVSLEKWLGETGERFWEDKEKYRRQESEKWVCKSGVITGMKESEAEKGKVLDRREGELEDYDWGNVHSPKCCSSEAKNLSIASETELMF